MQVKEVAVDRPGYVYLLRAENGTYKIGRSKDPEARLKSLAVSPLALTLVHRIFTGDACALEHAMHRRYGHRQIRGEWFRLTEEDVAGFCKRPWLACVRRTVRDPETGDLVQRTFWGDLEAPPEFLQESIRQRLEAVRADLRSVEADVAYLAANRPELAPRLTQMLARFNPRDEG